MYKEFFIFPFNFIYDDSTNPVTIILPKKYPVHLINGVLNQKFSTFKIKYYDNLYFEEFPIQDRQWRNLYAHFYDKKLKQLFRDINKYIYTLNFVKLDYTITKIKKNITADFYMLKKEISLKDKFWNYVTLIKIINRYGILDGCVVEEMGLYKLKFECFKYNIDFLTFLSDADKNKTKGYPKDLVKLYLEYIKPTKDFCWYFGALQGTKKMALIKDLESGTGIKFNSDVIHDWIPKISKKIIGKKYDITKH